VLVRNQPPLLGAAVPPSRTRALSGSVSTSPTFPSGGGGFGVRGTPSPGNRWPGRTSRLGQWLRAAAARVAGSEDGRTPAVRGRAGVAGGWWPPLFRSGAPRGWIRAGAPGG